MKPQYTLRHSGWTIPLLRDYEYVRLGTSSLLAAIGSLTLEAIPLVSPTHKRADFVRFLMMLNVKYPVDDKIRLIFDNHSAHTSRETQEYLNTVSDRFEFIFAPTCSSWLNMVEGFLANSQGRLGHVAPQNKVYSEYMQTL